MSRSILVIFLLMGNLFPSPLPVPNGVLATIIAVPIVGYEVLRRTPLLHPVIPLVAVIFAVVAIHGLIVPPLNLYGAEKLNSWVTMTLLVALCASLFRDRESIITLFRTWIIAAVFLSVATIVGFDSGRATTFDANPIWLGRAIATGLVAMLWFAWTRRAKMSIYLPIVIVLLVALLMTGSRGPILGCVVALGVLTVFTRTHRILRASFVVIMSIGAYFLLTVGDLFAGSRIAEMIAGGSVSDDSRGRLWDATYELVFANLFGVGIGNWSTALSAPTPHLYPHNIFLEILSELGPLIAVAFISLILIIAILLARRIGKDDVALLLLCMLSSQVVYSSASGDLNASSLFFVLVLGFLYLHRRGIIGADETGRP